MKRKLLTLLLVIASVFGIFAIANKDSKEAEAATATETVNALLDEYYNEGVYVKNTEIKLTEAATAELRQYFHVENHLVRTTYYQDDALWMSQGKEADGVKYSYYGTHADGGVTYGVANEALVTPTSVSKVLSGEGKNSMEEYYTTLADIKANTATWEADGKGFSTKDPQVLNWFLDFTAPCLYSKIANGNYFTYAKAYVEKTEAGLKMCLYVTSENYGAIVGGVAGQDNVLSEATVTYKKDVPTLYYYNDLGFTTVYAYLWAEKEKTTWPGVEMQPVEGKTNWYYIELVDSCEGATSAIFNSGNGIQTGDININLDEPYYYSLFTSGKTSFEDAETASAGRTAGTWSVAGTMNNWSTSANKTTQIGDNLYGVKFDLNATTYKFKFVNNGSSWYGNNGTMNGSANNWKFSTSEGDCTLKANAGTYWFVINSSSKIAMVGRV